MSVQPPRGLGRVRVLEIEGVDLQPCGGTHVANTAEVGAVVVTKIEKKSAMTRRVVLGFAPTPPLPEAQEKARRSGLIGAGRPRG
jgi:misacylated tRNA(Ala) deacylase